VPVTGSSPIHAPRTRARLAIVPNLAFVSDRFNGPIAYGASHDLALPSPLDAQQQRLLERRKGSPSTQSVAFWLTKSRPSTPVLSPASSRR